MPDIHNTLDALGRSIQTSSDNGGRLVRALQAAVFRKSLTYSIITTVADRMPAGFVANWALKDVLKIKKN